MIFLGGPEDLGVLNSSHVTDSISISQQDAHVELLSEIVRIIVVNHQTLLVVALMVSIVVENGSREGVEAVVSHISTHKGDNVIRIELMISQNGVHVSHIGLVSVVEDSCESVGGMKITIGTSKQDCPLGSRGNGQKENKERNFHFLQRKYFVV